MPAVKSSIAGQARLLWVDAAKGLGIALVVYGHVARSLVASLNLGDHTLLSKIDYVVYTFHMPLFFFLAGIFARRSYDKGQGAFWTSKFHTIVYPYFLWSIIQGSLLILFSGFTNSHSSFDRLANILWTPIAPFWFFYALFFCHVLFVLSRRLPPVALLLFASALFLAGEFYRLEVHDMSVFSSRDRQDALSPTNPIHEISVIPDIARGFLYYAMGVLAARRLAQPGVPAPRWIVLSALAFAIAATAGLWLNIGYELNAPAALLGIAAIVLLCRACSNRLAPIAYLGARSMPIFVMHIAVAAGVRIILMKLLFVSGLAPNLISGVLFGLLAPCVAFNLADRLGLAGWLGFTSLRRNSVGKAPPAKAPPAAIRKITEIAGDVK
jgi:fucose 4-O-acetylase-like acetyltransferase